MSSYMISINYVTLKQNVLANIIIQYALGIKVRLYISMISYFTTTYNHRKIKIS